MNAEVRFGMCLLVCVVGGFVWVGLSGCEKVVVDQPPPGVSANLPTAWTDLDNNCVVRVVEIEGHRYLLGACRTSMTDTRAGTGFAMLHAASCHCFASTNQTKLER